MDMKNNSFQPTISEKILLFIEYCLPLHKYRFSYETMRKILKDFFKTSYEITTLRKEFSLLKKAELISFSLRYRKKIPILTRHGKLKITPSLPYRKYGDWDGKWRMVLIDIPKKYISDRNKIRKILTDLSFKKIQKGAYISPHPFLPTIKRFSSELGIRQYLTIFETDTIDREKNVIQNIWDLNKINKKYKTFIRKTRINKNKRFWALEAKTLEQKFYGIYQSDPHLPPEFLPKNWSGDKAYELYKKIVMSY